MIARTSAVRRGSRAATSRARGFAVSLLVDNPGWVWLNRRRGAALARGVGYSSGQRGQTVNLLAYAYEGSNPSPTTTFPKESEGSGIHRTECAQNPVGPRRKMRFPAKVRYPRVLTTIYGQTKAYNLYRASYYAGGRRIVRSIRSYAEALKEAESKVREPAQGNQTAALSDKDAAASLSIRDASGSPPAQHQVQPDCGAGQWP